MAALRPHAPHDGLFDLMIMGASEGTTLILIKCFANAKRETFRRKSGMPYLISVKFEH
jgi:hypothetical protein